VSRGGGVRVTGGRWRGRRLIAPAGARPTSAVLREALFSIWRDRLPGAVVLDLFAGSGVVGLEALGRGASRVVLVDASRKAREALRESVASLGAEAAEIRFGDVGRLLAAGRLDDVRPDLVFADPPYELEWTSTLTEGLGRLVRPGAALAVERRAGTALPELVESGWLLDEERRYGDSALGLYLADVAGG